MSEPHEDTLKQIAMIDMMVDLGLQLCGDDAPELFNLTVASPGVVIALYVMAFEAINDAKVPDVLKVATRQKIRANTMKMLKMVMQAVESEDPKQAVEDQRKVLEQSIKMGPTQGDVQ